jgi:hypothetical protein
LDSTHALNRNISLAIIGLGYFGLPLAVNFAKKRHVVGFNINPARIAELEAGRDKWSRKSCGRWSLFPPAPKPRPRRCARRSVRTPWRAAGTVLQPRRWPRRQRQA